MVSPRIFYGVNGEGLGHISRTLAVIEHLPPTCEVHVFTYGKAYEYMQRQHYPHIHRIEGMMFSFKRGQVNYWKTTKEAVWFMMTNKNQEFILQKAEELSPTLFISDYEPSIPRAAHALRKPILSIDNQHRFAYNDFSDLPLHLRMYGWGCGLFTKWIIPWPDQAIVSTFHYDHIRPSHKKFIVTNGLIRKSLEQAVPKKRDFVLVYSRESISQRLLEILKNTKNNCYKIYGVHRASWDTYAPCDQFEFCELGPGFGEDLANCRCLVGSAGNQLISEARFLGKPILAVPEPRQYEQSVNAFYVGKLGLGVGIELHRLTPSIIEDFVNGADKTTDRVPNGIHKVLEVIEPYLNG